jgi:Glycine rich protein
MNVAFVKILFNLFCLFIWTQAIYGQEKFMFTGELQEYIVPKNVSGIRIECFGAQGGNGYHPDTSPAGKGAYISGEFQVTPGETLMLIVGGKGEDGDQNDLDGGGGGGGTFVWQESGEKLLIIAGGGGGGSYQADNPGGGGLISEKSGNGGFPKTSIGEGGKTSDEGGGGCGCGGGGWNSDGDSNSWCTGGFKKGGFGGESNHPVGKGGYGGGGGTYHGGGGGGGYTGGNGGVYSRGGGGGGSFNLGEKQDGIENKQEGDGLVIITILCTALEVTHSDLEINSGETVVLHATSKNGGDISWDGGIENGVTFYPKEGVNTYTASSSNSEDCALTIEIKVGLNGIDADLLCDKYLWITLDDKSQEDESPNSVPMTIILNRHDGGTGITAAQIGLDLKNEEIAKGLKILPNPYRGEIEMTLKGPFEYTLMDGNGRILQGGSANGQYYLRMYKLKAGTYFLYVKNRDMEIITKVIKN